MCRRGIAAGQAVNLGPFARIDLGGIDVPGLMTPVLKNVPYRHLPRPLYPLDEDMQWEVGAPTLVPARRGKRTA